eukprot:gnl/MRDRNA2_/MRDRNA2_509335_c0_seq1.p1 gnl/MRDRNA2_/MRDRNA2_509335_c0~~gnl/MRDRNA2_/MRDRNA2_509335_c0_seq1.p1  ORF type:complete len:201 (+),score=39.14 gnl/MRDRNA2_/MRDRNA2_509335_c0_seq1:22-603(+)
MSNTVWFQDNMDWHGVLIEANPYNAKKLKRNRPGNAIYDLAVCPEGQKEIRFQGAAGSATGGSMEDMSAAHKAKWQKDASHQYSVPCRPLGWMLRNAKIKYIDFFSLDVEGGELQVLQTMDWSIPVRVWVVELDGTNPKKDQAVKDLLFSKGYVLPKDNWKIMSCPPKQSRRKKQCIEYNTVFENPAFLMPYK